MEMSEAEYGALAWRLSERPEEGYKSDMELYEEAQKMKTGEQVAEGSYAVDAILKEGKIQAARALHEKMVTKPGQHDKAREGYLSDTELIEEGQTQDARGKTGHWKSNKELIEKGQKERAKLPPEHPMTCPRGIRGCTGYFFDDGLDVKMWIEQDCPLWIEHEAKCSHKLMAISLAQIANILATNLFSRR